ncbi:MAG: rhomboid family intramembrane serine protease [Oscillospiraceae bacterium]
MKKISYNSPVILSFAFISLTVLLIGKLTGGYTTLELFCVYRSSLLSPLTYLRFFTHVLGHSSYQHYINNILLMLVIGPAMEEKYGSKPLLIAIAVTAFISGLIQFIFFPGTALLGASGIVFMLIILSSFGGLKKGTIPLTLILVSVFYIGGEIVDSVTANDNVSHMAHIIGGTCGGVFGFIAGRHSGRRSRSKKS